MLNGRIDRVRVWLADSETDQALENADLEFLTDKALQFFFEGAMRGNTQIGTQLLMIAFMKAGEIIGTGVYRFSYVNLGEALDDPEPVKFIVSAEDPIIAGLLTQAWQEALKQADLFVVFTEEP